MLIDIIVYSARLVSILRDIGQTKTIQSQNGPTMENCYAIRFMETGVLPMSFEKMHVLTTNQLISVVNRLTDLFSLKADGVNSLP